LNDIIVEGITSSLNPVSRVLGKPERLASNSSICFQGSVIFGIGFAMEPKDARGMIDSDQRNSKVIFPFLNGQDVNTRADSSPSRWIIDFHDWSEEEAATYPVPYKQACDLVRPDRATKSETVRREPWWQYWRRRPGLYAAIAGLNRVTVITLVSKVVMPVIVPTGYVFSQTLGVFATDGTALLALLSSAPHYWWTVSRASSMKADLRYTPSDVFETLALPELTQEMRELGDRLDVFRRDVMLSRNGGDGIGLTATYNLVNSKECNDADIVELREIHKAIDEAVCRAYGWDDLIPELDHGIHQVGRDTRFTVGAAIQRELVDRLLELNHERYAAEVAAGLHDKKTKKAARATSSKAVSRKPKIDPDQAALDF
jgi:hypothetical protein